MPLPLILGAAALIAAGVGVKKGVDGYQTKSKADDLIDSLKTLDEESQFELQQSAKKTTKKLDILGQKYLEIGESYTEFDKLSRELLKKLNSRDNRDLVLKAIPKQELEKMDKFSISAVEFLGTLGGAGAVGAGAAFATYSGVMALGAASTGTAISALSGVAATNATLAALGGGSLAAGGLGMAGGMAVLSSVVAGPVIAIAGWAYNSHAEKAYDAALKAEREAEEVFRKREKIKESHTDLRGYARQILNEIDRLYDIFSDYKDYLVSISHLAKKNPTILNELGKDILENISNGYKLAAILVDVVTTPLYKMKTQGDKVEIMQDANGANIINVSGIRSSLNKAQQAV